MSRKKPRLIGRALESLVGFALLFGAIDGQQVLGPIRTRPAALELALAREQPECLTPTTRHAQPLTVASAQLARREPFR